MHPSLWPRGMSSHVRVHSRALELQLCDVVNLTEFSCEDLASSTDHPTAENLWKPSVRGEECVCGVRLVGGWAFQDVRLMGLEWLGFLVLLYYSENWKKWLPINQRGGKTLRLSWRPHITPSPPKSLFFFPPWKFKLSDSLRWECNLCLCISIWFVIKHLGTHVLSAYNDRLYRTTLMNHRQIKELWIRTISLKIWGDGWSNFTSWELPGGCIFSEI